MSLFLGPIHKKVYTNIINQDKINNYLVNLFNLEDEIKVMNEKFGIIIDDNLENLIDMSNIHGWLESRVNTVNDKFAFINSHILLKKVATLEELKQALKYYAKSIKEDYNSIVDYFNIMENNFIDGMPCDFTLKKITVEDNQLSWQINNIQKKHWIYGVNESVYFELRNSFMEGLVDNTNLEYNVLDNNIFELTEKRG